MNKGIQEKVKITKEEYKIRDIFAKSSATNVNEVIKKSFLINLRNLKLE